MFVCCECCVLSGRGLCDKLITRPEESYWLWCVIVCDLETSRMRRPWPALGRSITEKKKIYGLYCTTKLIVYAFDPSVLISDKSIHELQIKLRLHWTTWVNGF